MKKCMRIFALGLFCIICCLMIQGPSKVQAAEVYNYIADDTSINNELANLYEQYQLQSLELESEVIQDADSIYCDFVQDNSNLLNQSVDFSEGKNVLNKLKKESYMKLNKTYAYNIRNADRLKYTYMGSLIKFFFSNSSKYEISPGAAIEKIKPYMVIPENNDLQITIKSKINETKESIKILINESMSVIKNTK